MRPRELTSSKSRRSELDPLYERGDLGLGVAFVGEVNAPPSASADSEPRSPS